MPILNDLEVTIEDEGSIIHYSYDGSEQSPEVQRLEWSKDGRSLDMTTRKFVGGSIFDRSLKIILPTEDDKGKYSCKITNAVGSVSKSVIISNVKVSYVFYIQYIPFYNVTLSMPSFTFARETRTLRGLDGSDHFKTILVSFR